MAKKSKKQRRGPTPPRARKTTGLRHHPIQGVSTYGADDAEPMPPVEDGLLVTPMDYDGEQVTLHIPTGALVKVSEIAEQEGLELAWPNLRDAPAVPAVAQDAQHALASLARVTGEDGTDFVRALARIFIDTAKTSLPSKAPRAWQGWVDLPTRYVGMMLEASKPREAPASVKLAGGPRPRWAGSHTFDKVFDKLIEITEGSHKATFGGGAPRVDDPRVALALASSATLSEAHLLRVEADQVELLPDWDDPGDARDFALDCHVPFDPLYFEFEGTGGVAPTHAVTLEVMNGGDVKRTARGAMVVRGALVERGESENLTVTPFGDVFAMRAGESAGKARQRPSMTDPRAPAGRVVFGHHAFPREPGADLLGKQRLVVAGADGRTMAEADALAIDMTVFSQDMPGVIALPFTLEEADRQGWDGEAIVAWAAVVMAMALRVLAVLSIMESEAVVVDEAVMEVRDRKRAEKRGWNIADQVFVRPTRKGGERRETTGEHREYSHRFWVSGHYKHYPIGTRVADRRPDLLRPCTRAGEASCGMCRRVWTAPFIKGPEDRPLVVKSLVRRSKEAASA